MNNIDYKKLFDSLEYFKNNDFEYIDLDWVVDYYISNITKPIHRKEYFIDDKVLVASAEQTFLQMMYDQKLKNGRYCGLTPCFRDEECIDYLHSKYFMKVELIDTLNVDEKSLFEIIDLCIINFQKYISCEVLKIDEYSYDIIDSKYKIELGSYGLRSYGNYEWIYATGIAEPRLSKVIGLIS